MQQGLPPRRNDDGLVPLYKDTVFQQGNKGHGKGMHGKGHHHYHNDHMNNDMFRDNTYDSNRINYDNHFRHNSNYLHAEGINTVPMSRRARKLEASRKKKKKTDSSVPKTTVMLR